VVAQTATGAALLNAGVSIRW